LFLLQDHQKARMPALCIAPPIVYQTHQSGLAEQLMPTWTGDIQEADIQTKKDRVFHKENSVDTAVSDSVPRMASAKGEQTVI
jgi:hypothetical protein